MSPKSKYSILIKNSLWGSGSFVLISLVSFFLVPFIVKKLSVEGYGIYILITSLVGFYAILDLGLGSALVKFVAELHEKNEFERLNLYINSTVAFQGLIGLLSSIAIVFFSRNVLNFLKVGEANLQEGTYALNICAFGFLFTFVGGAYRSVLQGLQLYKFTSLMDTFTNLALNILVAVALYMGYGLVGSVVVNVFVACVSLVAYYALVRKRIPTYVVNPLINIKILKNIVSFSLYIFLSKISALFSNYIVRFVISFFLGPAAVTYYTIPSKLVGAIGGISSSGISAIFPFSSQLSAANRGDEIGELFLKSSRVFIATVFPITVFVCLFSNQILTVWMGPEFAQKTWIVLSITAFSSFIGGLSAIPNLITLGQGNSKLIGSFSILTITLYLIFLPLFTKLFGILGTSIALLIASTTVIYYVIFKTTQYTFIRVKDFFNVVLEPHLNAFVLAVLLFPIVVISKNQQPIIILMVGGTLMIFHYVYLMKKEIIPIQNIYDKLFQKQ